MKKIPGICILIWILSSGLHFDCFAQDSNCLSELLRKGDNFMAKGDYGNAMLQYASAFSCENVTDFKKVRDKIQEVIDRLELARKKAEDAERRAVENLKLAEEARDKEIKARAAKDSALVIATINAKRAEALLMTALAQNQINQGLDPYNAMLLAYGGYRMSDGEAKTSAYNTFLKAAYLEFPGTAYISTEAVDRFDQLPMKEDLLVQSGHQLSLLSQQSPLRVLDASCPEASRISIPQHADQVVSWGYDPDFNLLNTTDDNKLGFRVHSLPVLSLAYTFDGRYIVSGARDNSIAISPVTGGDSKIIATEMGRVYQIIPHPSSSQFLARSSDGTIRLWNIDGSLQTELKGSYFQCVAFSNDGHYIAAGDANKVVSIWDTSGKSIATFTDTTLSIAEEIVFVPDQVKVAIRTENKVIIASQNSGIESVHSFNGNVKGMMSNAAGDQILTWTDHGEVGLIPLNSHHHLIFNDGGSEILSASFSPDNNYIVSTSIDGTVILRDKAGTKLHTWIADVAHPVPVQFSYDANALYLVENGNISIRRALLPNLLLQKMKESADPYKMDFEKLAAEYGLKYVDEVWKE